MAAGLNSPLSGPVNSGFGGSRKYKSKIIFGISVAAFVPFIMSTFAASVTVGNGNLEFGQGTQAAVACDPKIYVAMAEEWHAAPTPDDSSAGFFRVRSVTISNVDFASCAGKKLRVRLIDGASAELTLGSTPESKVIQVTLPSVAPTNNISDPTALLLSYLTGTGTPISGPLLGSAALSVSGTSVYDGSVLNVNNGDVTFYLDPSATTINIDGQQVRRTTVETIDNPNGVVPAPAPTQTQQPAP